MMTKSDDDGYSTFVEYVEFDRGICSNCYRRTHYDFEVDDYAPRGISQSTRSMLSDERVYTTDTERGYPPEEILANSSIRRYCKCGVVDYGVKIRPLDRQKVMVYAHRVADRLDEEGVEIDKNRFLDHVRVLKENPDNQFDEESIFETAVEQSIVQDE